MTADETPKVVRNRTISQIVLCPAAEAYGYAVNPDNLPTWAAGLVNGTVTRDGEALILDSPMGPISVRFAPRNAFGLLDHDVTVPSGAMTNNPFRVIAHPNGSELLFTVRQIDLSDTEFERDIQAVTEDLARLKDLLEADER